MTDRDPDVSQELQHMVQFESMYPTGLVDFDAEGLIRRINPEASDLIVAAFGTTDFSAFTVCFELRPLISASSWRHRVPSAGASSTTSW
jgi:hypothetical protein